MKIVAKYYNHQVQIDMTSNELLRIIFALEYHCPKNPWMEEHLERFRYLFDVPRSDGYSIRDLHEAGEDVPMRHIGIDTRILYIAFGKDIYEKATKMHIKLPKSCVGMVYAEALN